MDWTGGASHPVRPTKSYPDDFWKYFPRVVVVVVVVVVVNQSHLTKIFPCPKACCGGSHINVINLQRPGKKVGNVTTDIDQYITLKYFKILSIDISG